MNQFIFFQKEVKKEQLFCRLFPFKLQTFTVQIIQIKLRTSNCIGHQNVAYFTLKKRYSVKAQKADFS